MPSVQRATLWLQSYPEQCNPPRQKSRHVRTVAALSRKYQVAASSAFLVLCAPESVAEKKGGTIQRRTLLKAACGLVFMRLITARTEAFTSWAVEQWALRIEPPTRRFSAKSL